LTEGHTGKGERFLMERWGPCRICGFEQFKARYEKNGFKLENCLHCGLLQVRNLPNGVQLESYYEQEFFDEAYGRLQHNPSRQLYEYKKFNYRWDEIQKRTEGNGRILDIGCSFGFFLDAARRRGWDACGLEISNFAAHYARTHFGLTVVNKPLEDAEFESESFDVVTLWNVIEHLDDPAGAVRHIYRILKPGGLVVLTTGDIESPLAKLQGRHWRMFMPPIHLSHFSSSTIRYLLESAGLTLLEKTQALPYESLLTKLKLIALFKVLHISDKMLVYARKPRQGKDEKSVTTFQVVNGRPQ
jgi:2-polyprenyl-3-methyl-5-hydroxy-6-metoxy-1,4-benzoquinol methylase